MGGLSCQRQAGVHECDNVRNRAEAWETTSNVVGTLGGACHTAVYHHTSLQKWHEEGCFPAPVIQVGKQICKRAG